MAFVYLHRSERIKVEIFFAALIALVAFSFSLAWWVEAALAVALSATVAHLLLSRTWISGLTPTARTLIVTGAIGVVVALIWIHVAPPVRPQRAQTLSDESTTGAGIVGATNSSSGARQGSRQLGRDTAMLVERLRDFQRRVDQWSVTTGTQLKAENKNEIPGEDQGKMHIEHAKELSAGMFKLDEEFNKELKPQVIAMRKQLMDRVAPQSFTPKPTVDWALKYGFATYPNAVGAIADELEDLARMLPQS